MPNESNGQVDCDVANIEGISKRAKTKQERLLVAMMQFVYDHVVADD